jgi:predicted DNA-binding transcriptional regulator AlpA
MEEIQMAAEKIRDEGLAKKEADASLEELSVLGEDTLLTTEQAGKLMLLSKSALQKRRVEGKLPRFVRLGGTKVAYRVADIRDAIRQLVRSSTADQGSDA